MLLLFAPHCLHKHSVCGCVGFDGLDTVPSAFVLMGDFQSQPVTTASTDYSTIKDQFKTLANIISQYQRLQVKPS